MPARDRYHQQVRNALVKDGWTITHDPFRLTLGMRDVYVDLGAERLLAAVKGHQKIAVEVKSFLGLSEMADLEVALGQYILYHDILAKTEPDRELFVAVTEFVYANVFEQEPIGQLLFENHRIRLLVFDLVKEEVRLWKP